MRKRGREKRGHMQTGDRTNGGFKRACIDTLDSRGCRKIDHFLQPVRATGTGHLVDKHIHSLRIDKTVHVLQRLHRVIPCGADSPCFPDSRHIFNCRNSGIQRVFDIINPQRGKPFHIGQRIRNRFPGIIRVQPEGKIGERFPKGRNPGEIMIDISKAFDLQGGHALFCITLCLRHGSTDILLSYQSVNRHLHRRLHIVICHILV